VSKLLVGSATDVGLVRSNNQDQLLVAPGLYAVADGMGGHAAGEVASATAVRALQAAFEASDQHSAESLESAAKAANRAVWEQARTNRGMLGMGTTLVAVAVVEREDGTSGLTVAHIGDSRLYLYRAGALHQLTVDHSLVQELVDDGQISPAQAAVHPQRHVLTRALGVEPSVDVDLIDIDPELGDRFVLCSDGLPREASDDQIAAVLSRFADPADAARELVALANSRGGSDNVTVVVIDVLASENSPDTMIVVPGSQASTPRPADIWPGGDGATGPDGSRAAALSNGTQAPATVLTPVTRARATPTAPSPQRLTWRVVGFVLALCIVLGGAVAGLAWYARSTYYVAFSRGYITIFEGRPGGVLWFQPTVTDRTKFTAASVLAYELPALRAGQVEPSVAQANLYIQRLISEKREAEAVTPASARGAPHHHRAGPSPTTVPRPTTTLKTATRSTAARPAVKSKRYAAKRSRPVPKSTVTVTTAAGNKT